MVQDSSQLNKHLTKAEDEIKRNSFSATSTSINFENSTFDQIAKNLSARYNHRFEAERDFSNGFTISLPPIIFLNWKKI